MAKVDGQLDDAELLRRTIAGDREAADRLYRRFQPVVLSYLTWHVGSERRYDLEDITQQVFLNVMSLGRSSTNGNGAHPFRGEASVRTYLIQAARRTLKDARCRETTRRRYLPILVDHESNRSAPPPDVDLQKCECRHLIRTVLPLLVPSHRRVLKLLYTQQLSVKEAAEKENCTVDALRSRAQRAQQAMRWRLETVL